MTLENYMNIPSLNMLKMGLMINSFCLLDNYLGNEGTEPASLVWQWEDLNYFIEFEQREY